MSIETGSQIRPGRRPSDLVRLDAKITAALDRPTINRALDIYEQQRENPDVDSVAALVVSAAVETTLTLIEEVWEHWEENARELDLAAFTEAVGRTIVVNAADVEDVREQRARARRVEHHATSAIHSRARMAVEPMLSPTSA